MKMKKYIENDEGIQFQSICSKDEEEIKFIFKKLNEGFKVRCKIVTQSGDILDCELELKDEDLQDEKGGKTSKVIL